MMFDIAFSKLNYTSDRNVINLSNLNLTNDILIDLFNAMPEGNKVINIKGNNEVIDFNIHDIKEKGYNVLYDEGQIIDEILDGDL